MTAGLGLLAADRTGQASVQTRANSSLSRAGSRPAPAGRPFEGTSRTISDAECSWKQSYDRVSPTQRSR
eukprot:4608640-Pyramimonas_sp.AAC.1